MLNADADVAVGAGAFDYHHIQYLFHSYTVRDDNVAVVVAAAVVFDVLHVNVVFVVLVYVAVVVDAVAAAAVAVAVVMTVQRSLNVHWQFQEVSRSSVKARCSGRHVLADEGDGAQRQRSGPGVYFGRLLNNARMQLIVIIKFMRKKKQLEKLIQLQLRFY